MVYNTNYCDEFLKEVMHLALAMALQDYNQSHIRKFFQVKKKRSHCYSQFIGNTLKPKNKKGFLIRLSNELESLVNISNQAKNKNILAIDARVANIASELDQNIFLVTTHNDDKFFTEQGEVGYKHKAIFSTHIDRSCCNKVNINLVANHQKEFDLFVMLLAKHELSIVSKSTLFFKADRLYNFEICNTEELAKNIIKVLPTTKFEVYTEIIESLALIQ